MILTLTVNPSLDRTIEVPALVRGHVLRATSSRVDPGGKGVNVARALAANGVPALAVLPSGGHDGAHLVELLAGAGIATSVVPVAGDVRTNVAVVEPDGTTTKLNEAGPVLARHEVAAIAAEVTARAAGADWVVLSGSLPPGIAGTFYAELVPLVRASGARVALDSSGGPFGVAVPAGPDLVKPNREELAEATGLPVNTLGEVVAACQELRRRGAGTVLASLGSDGALLVDGSGAVHGSTSVVVSGSTVGAGDAMLAGFLAAGGAGPAALVEALAWGSAAASLPGSVMPGPADLDRSVVTVADHIDPTRRLAD